MLEQAHAELNRVYEEKMAMLNRSQQQKLREEENRWIKWRDAEAERIAQMNYTSESAYQVEYNEAMIRLINQRTEYLRLY